MKILFKHLIRLFTLWLVLGMCYATLELFFRGVTYLPMIFVGGLAGLCVGLLNQYPFFFDRHMWQQALIGTLLTLTIEYFSGCLLNIKLGLHLWSYTGLPFNIKGQICMPYGALWFLLMPFAIWADDWLRYKLFNEGKPKGTPLYNYRLLFTGR
jgi:uncharacterized membrane protein